MAFVRWVILLSLLQTPQASSTSPSKVQLFTLKDHTETAKLTRLDFNHAELGTDGHFSVKGISFNTAAKIIKNPFGYDPSSSTNRGMVSGFKSQAAGWFVDKNNSLSNLKPLTISFFVPGIVPGYVYLSWISINNNIL